MHHQIIMGSETEKLGEGKYSIHRGGLWKNHHGSRESNERKPLQLEHMEEEDRREVYRPERPFGGGHLNPLKEFDLDPLRGHCQGYLPDQICMLSISFAAVQRRTCGCLTVNK